MTPQEVFERDGFLVVASIKPIKIGSLEVIQHGEGAGSTVVVIGPAAVDEAARQATSAGWKWPPVYGTQQYFYKTIAE
jgi:hypothetical protein